MTQLVKKRYDLTTRDGWAEIGKDGSLMYLAAALGGPVGLAGFALYKYLTVDKEADAARDIIRAGRENGVDEMTIRLRKKAAFKLGSDVDGVPLKVGGDFGNDVEVHVKYG